VWIPAAVAMGAWVLGSFYYRGSGVAHSSSWSADLVLVCFAGAAALALGRFVRRQVQPYQATILFDGVIVALAAGALGAALLGAGLDRVSVGGQPTTLRLLYPLGALMLLSFSVWVVALTCGPCKPVSPCL